ncbi:MAG: hypothetical protein Q7S05_02180 [bacterium]|nr:hypothetical protein [bacterium]
MLDRFLDPLFRWVNEESDDDPPRKLAADPEDDPWGHSGESYAAKLRVSLDAVAGMMGGEIRTRYNLTRRCAELYRPDRGVIARVYAYGDRGVPKRAMITSLKPLSDTEKATFEASLPVVLEFRVTNI